MVGYDKITLGEMYSTVSKDAFDFYMDNTKRKKPLKQAQINKIITSMYTKVGEAIIEQEEGVYAKGFFYIVGHHFPKNVNSMKLGSEIRYCFETDRRIFTIMFDNLMKGSKKYLTWSMRKSFTNTIHKTFSKFLLKNNPTYKYSLSKIQSND